jgi:hypothetical protein
VASQSACQATPWRSMRTLASRRQRAKSSKRLTMFEFSIPDVTKARRESWTVVRQGKRVRMASGVGAGKGRPRYPSVILSVSRAGSFCDRIEAGSTPVVDAGDTELAWVN